MGKLLGDERSTSLKRGMTRLNNLVRMGKILSEKEVNVRGFAVLRELHSKSPQRTE
jgi:hypothetical protein